MELRLCLQCRKIHGAGTTCPGCGASLTLADESFFVGSELGRYRIEGVVGSGGMGVVFRAVHTGLKRTAALKMILPSLAGGEGEFVERFSREARILAQLKHPNIVEVYDFDVSPWGFPYYVMEFLSGVTLRDHLNRHGGDPTLVVWAPLLRDLAAALSHAHAMGIVHRDLKPENIFLARFGSALVGKVLDFGIAKIVGGSQDTGTLTATGSVIGTPNYLAPEQILMGEVSARTDQYALALIVAEMITGKAARAGKTYGEICAKDIHQPLPAQILSDARVTGAAREAILRATQPDPAARFPDVVSFVASLGGAGGSTGETGSLPTPWAQVTAPMATPVPSGPAPGAPAPVLPSAPAETPARKRRWWMAASAAAAVVLVVLAGLAWVRARRPGAGGAGGKVQALLQRTKELAAPVDAAKVLDMQAGAIVLKGEGCVYLLAPDSPQMPARVPLAPNQTVLGVLPSEALFLRDGNTLIARRLPSGGDAMRDEVLVKDFPEAGDVLISPSGRTVARFDSKSVTVYHVTPPTCRAAFEAPLASGHMVRAALSERYLAWVERGRLAAVRLDSGKSVLDVPFDEKGTRALAVQDESGLLAAGGIKDAVTVFDLARGVTLAAIPSRGEVDGLVFLPDAPTLAIAGEGGLRLWRPGGGIVASWGSSGDSPSSVRCAGGGLVTLDAKANRLELFAYRGLALGPRLALSGKDIWAVAAEPGAGRVFAGGADGSLYACDMRKGTFTAKTLHSQGITSMVLRGANLATCSDDRTIAVWTLAPLELVMRSPAHEFLVNALCLAGQPPSLWSSSSDGTVKRWSWPELVEKEDLPIEKLLGKRSPLHAVWAAPSQDLVLVGTWRGSLVTARRKADGAWDVGEEGVPSQVIYAMAPLPSVDAILMVGIGGQPGLYVYDIKNGRLGALDNLDCWQAMAAAASSDGRTAWVLGEGTLARYRFERDEAGGLTYEAGAALSTDLGEVSSAVLQPEPDRLVVGDAKGGVRQIPLQGLTVPPILKEKVSFPGR